MNACRIKNGRVPLFPRFARGHPSAREPDHTNGPVGRGVLGPPAETVVLEDAETLDAVRPKRLPVDETMLFLWKQLTAEPHRDASLKT